MKSRTDDLRIERVRPLLSPAVLQEDLPLPDAAAALTFSVRRAIEGILFGADPRLLVIAGPCSVHDPVAALDYAQRLRGVVDTYAETLQIVMRVYFEKPRTVVGWKGLINDPDLDGSYRINHGLRLARKLLIDITSLGVPAGTEFLDTTLGQFYTDTISWGAIGARTAESQIHRELVSGLSMPVGIKNRTDGNIEVSIDAIQAARHRHLFPSLTKEGAPAILETRGNDTAHLVLRGGSTSGPNYGAEAVRAAAQQLAARGLPEVLLVDCSHGNSQKQAGRQRDVAFDIAAQLEGGASPIRGVMVESHLIGGRQDHVAGRPLVYGQSITDACLSFEETLPIFDRLAEAVSRRRRAA
ncbi:MAG TPA: 3-deoxy-7-phosphoheptulonate synthase [Polyangiaceae bacterium]|nr:3-deoxy-7-phosphoheptulonate synthase [Polyangiaceae bacterium]